MKSAAAPALHAVRAPHSLGARVLGCALAAAVCAPAACRDAPPPARRATAALPSGVVARVGGLDVAQKTVEQIASAQRSTPGKALESAVQDALFALEASVRLPPTTPAALERAALARALLESLALAAEAKGPASDAEIQRITDERWIDLDRPVSVRVSHAVALLPKSGDKASALAVARAIQAAVDGLRDQEAFLRAARAVPAGDVQVRAERLPYLTPDGRGISTERDRQRTPAGTFDASFSQAANELREPGDQSEIVETRFGYHLILLEDRLPERRVSERDRRLALGPEVLSRRADSLRRELVAQLKATTRVEVRRDSEEQTAQLTE